MFSLVKTIFLSKYVINAVPHLSLGLYSESQLMYDIVKLL